MRRAAWSWKGIFRQDPGAVQKESVNDEKTGIRLTQTEIQQIRNLYDKSIKESEGDSAKEADKATREWFLSNGFRETESNGI